MRLVLYYFLFPLDFHINSLLNFLSPVLKTSLYENYFLAKTKLMNPHYSNISEYDYAFLLVLRANFYVKNIEIFSFLYLSMQIR